MRFTLITIPGPYGAYFIRELKRAFPDDEFQVILQGSSGSPKTRQKQISSISQESSLPSPPLLLRLFWKLYELSLLRVNPFGLNRLADEHKALVANVREERVERLVERFEPDLILIFGGNIVPQSVLSLAKLTCLNLHAGKLPHYRGSNTLKWTLYNLELNSLVSTVHIADAKVDNGAVVSEAKILPHLLDSFRTLFVRLHIAGVKALIRTVAKVKFGQLESKPQDGIAYTYKNRQWTPMQEQEMDRRLRLCLIRSNANPVANRILFQLHKRTYRTIPLLRPKTQHPFVLLYHEIADQPTPFTQHLGVSISKSDFEDHIRFLTSNYDVVPFSKLVNEPNLKNAVAVTFDDGFRSTLTEALPILEKYSCPSKHYVIESSIQGDLNWMNKVSYLKCKLSQTEFSNFVKRALPSFNNNPKNASMVDFITNFSPDRTPDEVDRVYSLHAPITEPALYLNSKELTQLAQHPLVELGAHTGHHYPLNRLSANQLQEEVVGSYRRMNAQFNGKVQGFSIPFGYQDMMTPQVVSTIRQVDSVVVSAYGGILDQRRIHGLREIKRVGGWGNLGVLWYQMNYSLGYTPQEEEQEAA